MDRVVAFLDASVLYAAPLRDLLLELAVSDLYQARWSARVSEEWLRAVLRTRPDLNRSRLVRTQTLMDVHVRDALVEDYESLIEDIRLPDADDRHVVAATITGRASVIVTINLKDFPGRELSRWNIVAQAPDPFLAKCFRAQPIAFMAAVQRVRARLRHPALTVAEHLEALRRQGLDQTAGLIAGHERSP